MLDLLLYVPLFIKLSETEKRILIVIAVIFAFLFVIIGLIVKAIRNWMKDKAEYVDLYLYDLCHYGILTTPKEVVRYVKRRESKTLYLKTRWPLRILIIGTIILICYFMFAKNGNLHMPFDILKDFMIELDWPKGEFFGINMVVGWPTIIKKPIIHLNVAGYITYIMTIIAIWNIINSCMQILAFISKIKRADKVSVAVFNKSLEPRGQEDGKK